MFREIWGLGGALKLLLSLFISFIPVLLANSIVVKTYKLSCEDRTQKACMDVRFVRRVCFVFRRFPIVKN